MKKIGKSVGIMNSPTFAHPAKIGGILLIPEMVLEVLEVDPFSTKPSSERKTTQREDEG